MLSYGRLSRRPETFRSFTGLDVSEFDEVHDVVESQYRVFERKRLSREDMENRIGGGRPFKLELEDRLLMLLLPTGCTSRRPSSGSSSTSTTARC